MKAFVSLLVLLSMACFAGCQGDIFDGNQDLHSIVEEPDLLEVAADLVKLSPGVMSSADSGIITIKPFDQNVVFACTVDNGVFGSQKEQAPAKNINAYSGDEIFWISREWLNDGEWVTQAFIEIILKAEQNIIGYVLIEADTLSNRFYCLNVLQSVLYPQIDGAYQAVSEEYVRAAIEKIKDELNG